MSDLISRQAVLDAIEDDTRLGMYSRFASDNDAQCFKDVIRELPSVENKGEWIPVSNRLPEDRQSVLVWCSERRNIYCACLEKEQWWIFGAFMKVQDEVVAWMPLPEPYKAEKGGE